MVSLSPLARSGAAVVALCAIGAYALQIYDEMARHPNRSLAAELWRQGRYFTYLTNLLVAYAFARFALTGRAVPGWAAGLTLWAATVGGVYHVLLSRDLVGLEWWADHGLHTVMPIAVVSWWLICAPKAGLRWGHAILWLGWPMVYAGYVLLRGEIDGRHPYFFLDPPLTGWATVAAWSAGLGLGLLIAGLGLVGLGRWLSQGPDHPGNAAPYGLRPR